MVDPYCLASRKYREQCMLEALAASNGGRGAAGGAAEGETVSVELYPPGTLVGSRGAKTGKTLALRGGRWGRWAVSQPGSRQAGSE